MPARRPSRRTKAAYRPADGLVKGPEIGFQLRGLLRPRRRAHAAPHPIPLPLGGLHSGAGALKCAWLFFPRCRRAQRHRRLFRSPDGISPSPGGPGGFLQRRASPSTRRASTSRSTRWATTPYHDFVYETALRHPGVVVMHESNLHHLIADITIRRGDWDAYVSECEYNGGPAARAFAECGASKWGRTTKGFPCCAACWKTRAA